MQRKITDPLFLCAALLLLALQLAASACGLGLTSDSEIYLRVAENLQSHYLPIDLSGHIQRDRPFLFSLCLALLPFDLPINAMLLNMLCLLMSFFFFYQLLLLQTKNTFLILLLLLYFVFSTDTHLIHHFLWTEALFLSLLLWHLYALSYYLQLPKPTGLILLSLSGFLLCLCRNAGIFFIPGTALALFLFLPSSKKGLKALLFFCSALSGWLLWLLLSKYFSDAPMHAALGNFWKSPLEKENILMYWDALSAWFIPTAINPMLRMIVWTAFIMGLTLSSIFYSEKKTTGSQRNKAFLLIQLIYFIALQNIEKIDREEAGRYISILFPLFLVWLAGVLEPWLLRNPLQVSKKILYLLLIISLFYPIFRTLKNIQFWNKVQCLKNIDA